MVTSNPEVPTSQSQKFWENVFFLAMPLVAFLLGIIMLWSYLGAEHARLAAWEIPLIWMSEAVALAWYLLFGWYFLRNVPEDANGGRLQRSFKRGSQVVLWGLLLGVAVDGAFSVRSWYIEGKGAKRAVKVDAEVVSGNAFVDQGAWYQYVLYCAFRTADGEDCLVRIKPNGSDLPLPVRMALELKKLPVELKLEYDPQWPQRCWIAGKKRTHWIRLHEFSIFTIAFQLILGFLLYQLAIQYPNSRVPPVATAPFLAVATWIGMFGILLLLRPNFM